MVQYLSSCYEERNSSREAPSVGEEPEGGRSVFIGADVEFDVEEVGMNALSSFLGEGLKLLNEGTHGRPTPPAPHIWNVGRS